MNEAETNLVKYIWEGDQFDLIRNYNEILSQMDEKMHQLLDLSATRNNDSRKMCYKIKKVFEYLEKLEVKSAGEAEFAKYINLGTNKQDFRHWNTTFKSVQTSPGHSRPFALKTAKDQMKRNRRNITTRRTFNP